MSKLDGKNMENSKDTISIMHGADSCGILLVENVESLGWVIQRPYVSM